MSAQIIQLRAAPVRAPHDDSLRADCERLMRRLVREKRTPDADLRVLANVLDEIITRTERNDG